MDNETLTALLADVKNYLQISWDDEATNKRLREMIKGSAAYLDSVMGRACNYGEIGNLRTLLMERVRYQHCNALDAWLPNYLSLVIAAQREVRAQNASRAQDAFPA